MKRKIKIFDTCWHIAHQHDMIYALQDECEFYFCLNLKRQWTSTSIRPVLKNIHFVTHYEKGIYDIAILHIDQEVIIEKNQKRIIFDQFNSIITDIPKIVINHGTPVFPEAFREEISGGLTEVQAQNRCINIIKELLGNNEMVVNSYTAASNSEWGWGTPIIHGINPEDWMNLPKEPRVFTALSPGGLDTYYNRDCMYNVYSILRNKYGYILWYAKKNVATDKSFDTYQDFLGRSLLYIDTSVRTPMNRSRTEAFLSGCCVIQVEGAHDLDCWAEDGKNIVLVPNDPNKIAEVVVKFLENNYQDALTIGKEARKMAIDKFNPIRYKSDWLSFLNKLL